MKRTLSFMVMALALLLTQCRKPEVKFPSPVAPEGTTVSMTVTAGPGSKTDITTAGAITWSTGDMIYVGDGSKYIGCLTLQGEGGSATGTFSGEVTLPTGTENGEKTFHFFYLGSGNGVTLTYGAESVDVSFATQEIYANGTNLSDDAKKFHVGYGSANGTVTDGVVTGINVTLVSKVALARFSFKKNSADYTEALTLSGDNIYNSMKVNFGGTFTGEKTDGGNISLGAGHAERYVMLVPTSSTTGSQTLNFGGGALGGTTTLENGIESNKFYGRESAIAVTLDYEYVNLGLPSGLLWATCNLGASKPEEYGNYYAWGETAGYNEEMDGEGVNAGLSYRPGNVKTNYNWDYYKWGRGEYSLGKYVSKTEYGTPDDLTTLLPEDDAATKNWGSGWRMPTEEEFTELKEHTDKIWTTENGVAGWKCANKSDATKYIFIPAAGYRDGSDLKMAGEVGNYWSGSLRTQDPSCGCILSSSKSGVSVYYRPRYFGFPVRPVCQPQN